MLPRHEGSKLRRHELRDRNNLSGGCAEKCMLQEPDGVVPRKAVRSFGQESCNPFGGRRGKVRHLAIPFMRRMSELVLQPCIRPQHRHFDEDCFLGLSLREPACVGFSCLDDSLELFRSLVDDVSCWFHGRPSRRRSSFARIYNSLITGMRGRVYAILLRGDKAVRAQLIRGWIGRRSAPFDHPSRSAAKQRSSKSFTESV
jgi:hypothetical protein